MGHTEPRHITGFSNPSVKYLRSLRDKKHRKRSGQFLVEGLRLLTDARRNGFIPKIVALSETREPHPLLSELIDTSAAAGADIITTTPDILARITGKNNPQAVIGAFDCFDISLANIERSSSPIWLVAQAMRDPGNLGTMLRTADGVGAGGLILIDDSADPFSAEAVRASMGAIFTKQLAQTRWEEFLPWLRSSDAQLVAASLRDSVSYRDAAYSAPCFIMVGNESQGLPESYEDAADIRVRLPMHGAADSLNASVAGAVLAYEVLARLESGT